MKYSLAGAFLASALICKPWPVADGGRDRMVIWNVGQGSWATLFTGDRCLHFDMGGEPRHWPAGVERCLPLPNALFLSHLDWDHIAYISAFQRRAARLCLHKVPRDFWAPKISRKKKKMVEALAPCSSTYGSEPATPIPRMKIDPQAATLAAQEPGEILFQPRTQDANSLSRVYHARYFLFPGDSSRAAEKLWAPKLPPSLQVLVLGHHGSRTSTSDRLLFHLPRLKFAVVSARQRKYGHPHPDVLARLKRKRIPILLTEKWGHLIFEF